MEETRCFRTHPYVVAGSTDPAVPNGTFSVVGEVGYPNGSQLADAIITADGLGWCLEADVYERTNSADCNNLTGWWQVVGDRSATLVEDGEADGCPCGCWEPSDGEPEAYCR